MVTINIAKDFTRFPSGRFRRNGETSGEAFRQDFLERPISDGKKVVVQFDGTIGYGSSFLEEAFGGLVRALNMKASKLNSLLTLESSDQILIDEVLSYIEDASSLLADD